MLNLPRSILGLVLAALAFGPQAHGQDLPDQRVRLSGSGAAPIVLSEARQQLLDRATELDTNGDGVIDADELFAARQKAHRARAEQRLQRMDANQDGQVTVEEFVNARHAYLAGLDADGDGIVSIDEQRRGHQRGHGRRLHRGHRRGDAATPPPAR